ncbi:MAG TPA: MFS transporter [Dehalococcoidales bacterium]
MRRYFIFIVASTVLLLSTIDSTAVAVAYPVIISYFNISLVFAGWVLTAYQMAMVSALPISGKISDSIGRKTAFLMFVSLFGIGSLLCSLAPNAPLLILFRIIQGLGGSGLGPTATGIVADEFPESRPKAVGLVASFFPIGMIVGPNLGGWMTTALGWRSIFWINIPLCLIVLVVAAVLMSKGSKSQSHFDLMGSGLLAMAILALIGGVSILGSNGSSATSLSLGIVLVAIGLASLVFFWRRTRSTKHPIIEPEILRKKPFLAANAYNFVFGALVGAFALIPLYAVSIYRVSTLASGVILTPRSVGMILASIVSSLFLVRRGYRLPMLIGTLLIVPCFAILALEPASFSFLGFPANTTLILLAVAGLEGIAEGVALPGSNNACIELMPDRIATITSMRAMFRQAGNVTGITLGSVILHVEGIDQGFHILFWGLVVLVILIMLPAIFAMPNGK